MRPTNWNKVYVLSAILGILVGYLCALVFSPALLPPLFRLGGLIEPKTILFLGTDVVYNDKDGRKRADKTAFNGRTDTIMVTRLDPYRNSLDVISIPRDTQANIPGFGVQKINAANVLGGPELTLRTVGSFLDLPVEDYLILNVHGLVEMINELGGITVEIPKPMHYMDWTAKLRIDLEPGFHTLTGNQAMGFVRFRHDALGDIGRVQRQEIFIRALLDRASKADAWLHIPKLISIAQRYIDTNMSMSYILRVANFMRGVPKSNRHMVMLPGHFSGTGDWVAEPDDVHKIVAKFLGSIFVSSERQNIKLVVINTSSNPNLSQELYRYLRARGYTWILIKRAESIPQPGQKTKVVAQRANPEDANQVLSDLHEIGELIYASVGDIESGVTIFAGDDLTGLINRPTDKPQIRRKRRGSKHLSLAF